MLDNETKRRIDTCRDILVGKVPDPKSQVEQISIALIYKFMDDMDREAVEMGGKAGFFTGDYVKYAWSKIFDPRLGGFDMLALYSEAITRMSQNPGIPQLFRDIFKNAYLPYRDPETLKLFLKTINEFSYDHSERLGDAFEYLLSVLGSQGDAGQFRTPRHIIDFMVEVLKPQKHESILDPACGTAGFLISSYKHILRANTKKVPGDLLKTEERKKLLTNFKGYDISPDMVRLSLVNLYLHGFVQPQVMEYDTLTSEDKWNEYADVILANPPFMSPKGGIKPHKRFSVQSNRSEVLFVDYIAEHLTPTGRAAVIVPEGIIFQSANAYKQLRKYLVDEGYIYAVVSLPAGVFNPYSGVKTSILLMDKTIAKKADSVLFIKIDNDGFNLGAQRRVHEKNDLPGALELLNEYVDAVRSGKIFNSDELNGNALLVTKEDLANDGGYNLTGERHRVSEKNIQQKWPMVKLGEFADFIRGVTYSKEDESDEENSKIVLRANNIDLSTGKIIFTNLKKVSGNLNFKEIQLLRKNDILICTASGSADHIGKVGFSQENYPYYFGGFMGVIRSNNKIDPYYLYLQLKNEKFRSFIVGDSVGANIRNLNFSTVSFYQIPIPPLDVQREIVAEIEGYQKIIDGARQVVDNWKPQFDIDPVWPISKLGEITNLITKGTTPTTNGFKFESAGVSFIKVESISENGIIDFKKISYISNECHDSFKRSQLEENDILFSIAGTEMGISALVSKNVLPANTNQALAIIRLKENVNPMYVLNYLRSFTSKFEIERLKVGVAQFNLSLKQVSEIEIPLAPYDVQNVIVNKIESESKAVDGCRELIKIYDNKIKQVIDKVWEQ